MPRHGLKHDDSVKAKAKLDPIQKPGGPKHSLRRDKTMKPSSRANKNH